MRRPTLLVAAPAAAILVLICAGWLAVSQRDIGRSDFTSTYVGSTLLREGHGDHLYDESLQAPLHSALIAPDSEGNLPFVNPPAAALAALPLTLLGLAAAYRLFALAQLAMLVLGVALAVRASPGRLPLPRAVPWTAGLVALAGAGTASLALLGQWDGLVALAVGGGYALLRSGRPGWAGAVLAAGLVLAKPHLGIGLAAFLLAWRERRVIVGAVAGVAAVAIASLVVAGPGGTAGFASIALGSTGRWSLASMLGFTGLAGSWLGDGAATQVVAAVLSLLAVAAATGLGAAVHREPGRLGTALAGAVALSLVASPHLLGHDLAVLAPVAAWCLLEAARSEPAASWPGPRSLRVLALWVALNGAALLDLGNSSPAPPGRLVPLSLVGIAVAACTACGLWPARRRAVLLEAPS